ncbi:MAG: eukaryotic-like serine/threonine-protein kinase [Trebonia sp.]|nr:eukaryotic-like serine/threonine-protein kinase [Trebonia sp.]
MTVAEFGERYELIRRIGSGGMGEVWLANDEQLADRPVAIKIMHQHMLPNEGDVARFEREMRFAAMMDHPNIVTVYTTGTYDDAPFMVMEYLRGRDLEKALPGGGAERIAGIGRDVCRALAYAHGKGVLHRDIKPSNLFLCESGQVKVTDFGLATAVGGTTLTTAGVLVGTFAYVAPERWRAEPPTFSNDIWSAGCVLYRLISGRLPRAFPDATDYVVAAMRDDPVPDLRDITDAPAWLADPVMAMLAADPAIRPTAGECAQLLSGGQFAAPVPGVAPVPGGPLLFQPDYGQPELDLVIGVASEEPSTTAVPRPAAARTTVGRSWRSGRVISAIGAVVLLLLAGSITAWQLSASPQASGLAAHSNVTPPPASHAAAAPAPATSASASRSSAAAAVPPDSASPSASPAGSRSLSLASSPGPVHREFPLRIAEGHPHGQSHGQPHAERVGVKHAGRRGGP